MHMYAHISSHMHIDVHKGISAVAYTLMHMHACCSSCILKYALVNVYAQFFLLLTNRTCSHVHHRNEHCINIAWHVHLLIHSSYYYSASSSPPQHGYCAGLHAEEPQATVSEGVNQMSLRGGYSYRAGDEPTALRTVTTPHRSSHVHRACSVVCNRAICVPH